MRCNETVFSGLRVLVMAALVAGVGAAVVCAADAGCDEEGFVPIFDGKSLDGWKILYLEAGRRLPKPDAWQVKDGMIECTGYEDYWLRYEKEQLENFVLRLQVKMTPKTNSGIVIHAAEVGVPWHSGFEVQILEDHGQRPNKHGMGAIYDVVTPMYSQAKPAGEWNDMEVTCMGTKVQVVVNGLKVVDTDFGKMTCPIGKYRIPYSQLPAKGYLCLQDHGHKLWFRNVRVKKLGASCCSAAKCGSAADEEGFKTIFNGPGSKGWSVYNADGHPDPHAFVVIDDFVRCTATAKGENFYRYDTPLKDYILRGEFRVEARVNSGIILQAKGEGVPYMTGFEMQILEDYGKEPQSHSCGAIYDVVAPMFNASNPSDEWNQFEITYDKRKIRIVLNGWKVIDTDFNKLTTPRGKFRFPYSELPRSGYLCLQDHGGVVDFRNLRIKELND